ncbi:MAG: long-chain fatty acid--CoA ligase [Telluria sp.]
MALSEWIEHHAGLTPGKLALRFPGRDLSYGELAALIRQLASKLAASGVGRADCVAYLGLNSPEMLALLFACARLGALFMPLNWRLAGPEHRQMLADCPPKVLFVETQFFEKTDASKGAFPNTELVHFGAAAEGWSAWQDFLGREADDVPDAHAGSDTALLICYTSGSTGKPKGVLLSQGALDWNASNSADMHALSADDIILTTLPLFHVGGLNNQTTPALAAGCTVVLHPKFEVDATFEAIERERITLTVLVPAQLEMMMASPRWHSADLSSLRMITTGSTTVPDRLIRAVHARGVPLVQVYGSTETCPIAACLKAGDAVPKAGSTGRPAAHCRVRVVDPADHDVECGASGEIIVRGPNVMLGYWKAPEANAAALVDGWLHTGDIGHWDADGFLYVDGRVKDMIISGGENIYPAEIENVLAECPDIVESSVVGRPDPRWGEIVVAVVVLAPASKITAQDILSLFEGRIARYKHPKQVLFMERLPRTAVGKIRKEDVRRMLERA